ncbi:MAG: CHAT domain-containing protein [Caldilineaceae bacterium]
MDRTIRIKLRKLLVELYEDSRKIRQIISDADLNAGRINLGGSADNIWHDVLTEAEKVSKVDQLIETIRADIPESGAKLDALLGKRSVEPKAEKVVDDTSDEPIPTPLTTPPLARLIPIDRPRPLRLNELEEQLLSTLFAQATKLTILSEFTDGRTATRVLLVRPTARDGVDELPAVVKLGPAELIAPEWEATQRNVLDRLPGFAPVRGEPVLLADAEGVRRGALRYEQVGNGVFAVESLARYSKDASVQNLWQVMHERLFPQLGTLWRMTQTWAPVSFQQRYDRILPVNLEVEADAGAQGYPTFLDARYLVTATAAGLPSLQPGAVVRLEGFVVTECSADGRELTLDLPQQAEPGMAYRLRVQRTTNDPPCAVGTPFPAIVGQVRTTRQILLQGYLQGHLGAQIDLTQPTLPLPDQSTVPNPLLALPTLLARTHEGRLATIHGDLNLRNILIDPAVGTAHIIDCAAAHQDHVLHDLLRLERDILTDLAAQIFFQAGLPATAVVHFYRQLHCATRGAAQDPGHFALPTDLALALEKLFVMLVTVRQAARDFLATPGDWSEYTTGLIIHLLGALKFRDLENPPPGQQPKAIAFWAAATLLGLLDDLKRGDERHCRAIALRFFDITAATAAAAGTRGVTLSPTPEASTKGSDPSSTLESLPAKGLEPPTTADLAPTERRLDVAAPEQATVGRAFALAVAVRQNDSPPLAIAELPKVHSGPAQLEWPAAEPFVRLRVQVVAPDCDIEGDDSYTFKLYRNLDSVVYYFSLIPKTTGRLTIIVRLYQGDDFLSSAPAYTTVREQVVGEVPIQLQSSTTVAMKQGAAHQSEPSGQPLAGRSPIKILFLAANPLDMVRLQIGEEMRAIDQALRQAEHRSFDLQLGAAVRVEDLQELLLRHQPDILHFSGHGAATNEIILHNAQGNSTAVAGAALGRLFRVLKDNLRCIVLNACYTADNAAGLAQVIDCVVGIEEVISDNASIQFATAFYRALGYGRTVQEAFDLGQVQIELAGLGEAEALHLEGMNAGQIRFAGEQATDATAAPPINEQTPNVASEPLPHQPTVQTGALPSVTKRPLSTQAKMQLAIAMLACPSMANRQTRDVIINDLPDAIKGNIKRNDADRADVINILTTVTNYATGLEDLISLIRFYEGESIGMEALDRLFVTLG